MKTNKDYFLVVVGFVLAAFGVYLINRWSIPTGFMLPVAYISIGSGCGMFGHGIGNIVSRNLMKKHPEVQKQLSIEQSDERNLLISYRAKSKAFDFMTYLFATIMLVFALMQIDLAAILLLVFAYLLVQGYGIYYRIRYDKEM